MAVEIERKFLVNRSVWENSNKGTREFYQQGYVVSEPGKTIRVRLTETSGYITIKGPTTGISKPEFEYAIPKEDASQLLQMFCTSIVSKWRNKVHYRGKLWEIDEFLELNEGLMIAEIELKDEDEVFDLPEWIASEVTGDKRYSNSNLATNPYKNWKSS